MWASFESIALPTSFNTGNEKTDDRPPFRAFIAFLATIATAPTVPTATPLSKTIFLLLKNSPICFMLRDAMLKDAIPCFFTYTHLLLSNHDRGLFFILNGLCFFLFCFERALLFFNVERVFLILFLFDVERGFLYGSTFVNVFVED